MAIQAVKGTRDFYPPQLAFRNWLAEKMRAASMLFGYQEWDGPILEPFELYAAKSGDELVNEQAFVMEDRGGRKIVLRPELTPSLARIVAAKQQELGKPIRWFSIGPMWRYEQPQRGRSREFWQWNIDLLGVDNAQSDAELIAIAITFLQSLGLDQNDFVVRINDRKWFEEKLVSFGIAKDKFPSILRAVDRADKMPKDKWDEYVTSTVGQAAKDKLADFLSSSPNSEEGENLAQVKSILKEMNLDMYLEVDPKVVRGLDYYTGTVFEIRDKGSKLRAIGGGGRYANLVEQVGGQPLAGIGFALGDLPIEELLREVNKYPENIVNAPKVLVTVFNNETVDKSLGVANKLRKANIATELYLSTEEASLEKQLKYADQKAIPYAILLGPDEIKNNNITIKDLTKREQSSVPLDDFIRSLT